MGKKKQPVYKVVAADARSPRDGKFIEAIGMYNPLTNPASIDLNEERAMYWLGVGAQPTETVKSLLSKKGILLKKELKKQGLSDEEISVKVSEWMNSNEAKLSKDKKVKKAVAQSASEDKGAASE
jgi:small subunit ribosomal protein S16